MAITSFNTPLLKKEKNSSDAWNFYFEKPRNFNYQAGQYIKMKLDIPNPDDRGITRYFTLSSSPSEEYLMVTTRILKSSFKMRLGKVKVDEEVHMRGPWGDFTVDRAHIKPVVFIAGGIGMTPFRSILRFSSDNKLILPITLFVSYKTPYQILYKDELNTLQKEHENIKVITTITEPEGSGWTGTTGRISAELLQKHLDSFPKYVYYIAGPDPMVEGMEKLLLSLKIPKKQILTDGFPGY